MIRSPLLFFESLMVTFISCNSMLSSDLSLNDFSEQKIECEQQFRRSFSREKIVWLIYVKDYQD